MPKLNDGKEWTDNGNLEFDVSAEWVNYKPMTSHYSSDNYAPGYSHNYGQSYPSLNLENPYNHGGKYLLNKEYSQLSQIDDLDEWGRNI